MLHHRTEMINIIHIGSDTEIEEVRSLFQEYETYLGIDLCFQNFEEELQNLPGDYSPPHGCLLMGKHGDDTAGCVALRKIENGICEMKRLFVRPQSQGLGIGRALAETIIAEARRIGYQLMRLDTIPSMKRARCLYMSLGFKESTPYYQNPIPGTTYLELKLVK